MKKIFFISALFFTSSLYAASFDCRKASGFVETAICQTGELSVLDDQLNTVYKNKLQNSSNPDFLKQEQMQWLKKRNLCKTETCIRNAYEDRLSELDSLVGVHRVAAPSNVQSVSGSYLYKNVGGVEVLQRGNQIDFVLSASWDGGNPGQVNSGQACGTLNLTNGKALYTTSQDANCRINFDFQKGFLMVRQSESSCGFGLNVWATGKYKKTSSKTPKMPRCVDNIPEL